MVDHNAPASSSSCADSSPRRAADESIEAVEGAIDDFLEVRGIHGVPHDGCSAVRHPLVTGLNRMMAYLEETAAFVLALARGELSAPLPSADNTIAAPFVDLHAHLCQLTQQTNAIANGDYTQRVAFMGELSQSLNAMVELLAEREAHRATAPRRGCPSARTRPPRGGTGDRVSLGHRR